MISGDGRPERGTLSTTGEARSSNYHDNYTERKIVFYHYWPSLCCNSFYCEKNKVLYFKIIILTNHFLPLYMYMYVSSPWLIMMSFFFVINNIFLQDSRLYRKHSFTILHCEAFILHFFFNIAQNSDKKMWPESEKYRRETGTESELNQKMMLRKFQKYVQIWAQLVGNWKITLTVQVHQYFHLVWHLRGLQICRNSGLAIFENCWLIFSV